MYIYAMGKRNWYLALLGDFLLLASSCLGVGAVLGGWKFMSDCGMMTEAPFLVTFTGLSNLLIGVVALLCLLARVIKKEAKLPSWLFVTRMVFVAMIMVTFLVTAVYLSPSVGPDWWKLYINGSLFNHLITPVWAVLAFLLFEPRSLLSYRCTFFTFVPMGIYGIFYLIRAYTHVGPDGTISLVYDIYGLARWGLWATIGIFFAFMAASFLLCLLLFFQNSRKEPY